MAIYEYPYTEFNEYNLDWCIKRIRDLTDEWVATHQEWEDTETEWENYKNYIDSYFNNLDLQNEVNIKMNKMVADGTMNVLIAPFFADAISEVPTVVTAWINDNILQETGYVLDNSLTIQYAAADAKAVGDRLELVDSLLGNLPSYQKWVNFTKTSGYVWDYFNSWVLKPISGYYAVQFTCTEKTEYTIHARNIANNTTFALGYFNGSTLISSIIDYPVNPDHVMTITTPENCDNIKFSTNSESLPPIMVTETVYGEMDQVYVAQYGNDTHTGEESHPFQSIQAAINSGLSDTIIINGGRYTSFSCSDKKKLKLIGDIDTPVRIDDSKTITTIDDPGLGVKKGSFSSTSSDIIYKVFVTNEISIADTSGNVIAYTCNLWDYYENNMYIPKATITEVQNTPNTWTYDGSYIYVNTSVAENYFKLIDNNINYAAHFDNVNELIIDHIQFLYSGNNACYITNCANVDITACKFGYSGVQHGLAFESSNANIYDSESNYNCYDGYNIHDGGDVSLFNCYAGYNRDDGVSHHDASTGVISGGKYHHNGKGGISPVYDSMININNAFCVANGYGIYYSTITDPMECIINGCVLANNTAYGLRVSNYDIVSINTIYLNNSQNKKVDGGGSISEY